MVRAEAQLLGPRRDDHRGAELERTTRRETADRGHDIDHAVLSANHLSCDARGQPDEIEREQTRRPRVQLARRRELLDAALVHDRDAIRHRQRLVLVVGNEDRGRLDVLQQAAQLDLHLLAQLAIERRQRLVEQQHVGLDRDRARQRHALLLAARQCGDASATEMTELDQRQRPLHCAIDLRLRRAAHLQAEGDVARDGEMRKQRVALEHDADIAPVRRHMSDVAPGKRDRASVRRREAGDGAQQGGLAAAGWAEQGDQLAAPDREIDAIEHGGRAEALRNGADDEMRRRLAHVISLLQRSTQPARFLAMKAQSGANSEAGSG